MNDSPGLLQSCDSKFTFDRQMQRTSVILEIAEIWSKCPTLKKDGLLALRFEKGVASSFGIV